MKTLFACTITVVLAMTAYRADSSPVRLPPSSLAAPDLRTFAKPLAIMKETGGFCGAPCPTTVLTLHDNGHVMAETTTFHPKLSTSRVRVAQYNKKLVDVIQYEISQLTEAAVIDFDPEGPICADKAEKNFFVVRDGREMLIGAERDCHNYYMENLEGMSLVEVLKSLTMVYSYSLLPVPSPTHRPYK